MWNPRPGERGIRRHYVQARHVSLVTNHHVQARHVCLVTNIATHFVGSTFRSFLILHAEGLVMNSRLVRRTELEYKPFTQLFWVSFCFVVRVNLLYHDTFSPVGLLLHHQPNILNAGQGIPQVLGKGLFNLNSPDI